MYGVVEFMGEARGLDFFRRLAALKPEMRKGHILAEQLVAAGELPACPTVYSGNAESIEEKGGPTPAAKDERFLAWLVAPAASFTADFEPDNCAIDISDANREAIANRASEGSCFMKPW